MGRKIKTGKIVLDSFGSFLGMEKGCIIVRDREGNTEKYPLFQEMIGEVILQSGNMVSTGVLASLGFWGIDVVIATKNGRPIATLKKLNDDAHVKTRICQYEALKNGKGVHIAKQIVLGKVLGQNQVLRKYGLRQLDVLRLKERIEGVEAENLRKRLMGIEGKCSEHYFTQIFKLFDKRLRPEQRYTFHAYDIVFLSKQRKYNRARAEAAALLRFLEWFSALEIILHKIFKYANQPGATPLRVNLNFLDYPLNSSA